MNITTTYNITFDGETKTYTETREANDIREAHYQILSHWYGAEVEFVNDVVE